MDPPDSPCGLCGRCAVPQSRADRSFISCSVSTLKSVILTSGRLTTSPTSAVPSKASARERRSGSLPPPSCPASSHSSTTWCPADPTTHCLSMEAAFRHQASLGALDRVLGLGRPAPYLAGHRLRTEGPNTAQRHPLRAPKTPRKRPHPQPNRDRVHDRRVTYHGDPLSHLGVSGVEQCVQVKRTIRRIGNMLFSTCCQTENW